VSVNFFSALESQFGYVTASAGDINGKRVMEDTINYYVEGVVEKSRLKPG
jgi:hypothetical protein